MIVLLIMKIIMMNRLFLIVFFTCASFNVQALIIILNGTSSAGKTSIARELCNTLADCKYFHVNKKKRDELKVVKDASFVYQYVVFDHHYYKNNIKFSHILADLDICFVLVHCPLKFIGQHVKKRNEQNALLSGQRRMFDTVLKQFVYIYQIEKKRRLVIDQISLQDLNNVCSDIKSEAVRLKVISLFKENFLSDSMIQFKPIFTYDLIVNTGKYSVQECAQQIIEYIQNNNNFAAFKQSYTQHYKK